MGARLNKPETDLRQRYLDALERLESAETLSHRRESVLRLIIGRLSLAALGRSAALDAELRRLGDVLRHDPSPEDIEARLEPLSRSVAALDQIAGEPEPNPEPWPQNTGEAGEVSSPSSAAPALESAEGNEHLHARIVAMLERVATLPELEPVIAGFNSHPIASLTPEELASGLERVAQLIVEQRSRVRREKLEVEDLLRQIDARLEEVSNFLVGEAADQKGAQESTQQLNLLVLDEMHELNTDVQRAIDLAQLRLRVRERLQSITTHLQAFRNREEQRYGSQIERTGRLRVRIAELERESRDLQQGLQEEHRLALIDSLTGIANRAAYDERIRREIDNMQRNAGFASILAWDIDWFKSINDAYGHRAGDKVLRVVGQHLAQHVRGTDFVARYGGEEFLMILVGTSAAEARVAAEKIRTGIEKIGFHFRNKPVTVTASCGITAISADDTPDTVFDRADRALYRAKDAGRNCCVIL